jgi:hypothetical protein
MEEMRILSKEYSEEKMRILKKIAEKPRNNIMPPEKRFTYPNDEDSLYIFKTSLLANIFTEIIDYKIRPVTIAVGRDEHGRLRETRGFIGYIIIKINHPRIKRIAEKTFALANHLGIGRGRGIGLGEIEILKTK